MSLGRVTQPRWSTSWMGARLPSWAIQLRTSMSNLPSSSLMANTMVIVWPILTKPETSEAHGPFPTWICIQQPTLSPAKSARTTSNMSTGNGRNVTDFSYWSCQVQRNLRAWSQTSCTCGSNWTMMVFSKNVPEPACSINQQQQQKYVEFKNQFIRNFQDRYIRWTKKTACGYWNNNIFFF